GTPATAAPVSAPSLGASIFPNNRPSSVTVPSPVPLPVPPEKREEKPPAFDLPPGKPEGFDPYKARANAARDAARDIDRRLYPVPPSVAPSLTADQRLRRDAARSFDPLCNQSVDQVFPNAPKAPRDDKLDEKCRPLRQ
ncbi:MAG: hypothetical protein U1F05_11915, partial [Burkholderiales bacterium]